MSISSLQPAAEEATVSGEGVAENILDVWTDAIPVPGGLTRGLDVVLDFNERP